MPKCIAFEIDPKFYSDFEKLCVITALDYSKVMEKLMPDTMPILPTVEIVMKTNSMFLCYLVQNIIAVLTAQIVESVGKDLTDVVLKDFLTAITNFLNGKEFYAQLQTLIGEMTGVEKVAVVSDEIKQSMN